MKYMMFVVADPVAAAEAEPSEKDLTIDQWLAEIDGKRITGDRLCPVDDATTVRVSKGDVLVSDGPFTESRRPACRADRWRPRGAVPGLQRGLRPSEGDLSAEAIRLARRLVDLVEVGG